MARRAHKAGSTKKPEVVRDVWHPLDGRWDDASLTAQLEAGWPEVAQSPGLQASLWRRVLEAGRWSPARVLFQRYLDPSTPVYRYGAGTRKITALATVVATRPDWLVALIGEGADVHVRNENGGTLLHTAAQNGSSRAVRVLLDHGLDPLAVDASGHTPLMAAVMAGRVTVTERLLAAAPAAMAVYAASGYAPIHAAVMRQGSVLIACLARAGADLNAPTHTTEGMRPLHMAENLRHQEAWTALLDHGADPALPNVPHAMGTQKTYKVQTAEPPLHSCRTRLATPNAFVDARSKAFLAFADSDQSRRTLEATTATVNKSAPRRL